MAPTLSGHFPVFGLALFELKSLWELQNSGAVEILQF